MTNKEAAIVSAYTGVLIGDFGVFHMYIEHLLGRPVFTHALAYKYVVEEIKRLAKEDFKAIQVKD